MATKKKPVRAHVPLDQKPHLFSPNERKFWDGHLKDPVTGLIKTRRDVFTEAGANTPNPSNPSLSLSASYVEKNKLHDREPECWRGAVEKRVPGFFDSHPMSATAKDRHRHIISKAAKVIYKYGVRSYGKPKLRKP
jgi:hypothetical protein